MVFSYWLSANAPKAWLFTFCLIFSTGLLVLLNMKLNNWQVDFYNHLQQRSLSGFYHSLLQFAEICSVLVITSGWQTHFKMLLQLRWRQWLTNRFITMWLHNQTYFHMKFLDNSVDNPDQRIAEDIQLFVNHSLELVVGFLRHLIALIVFSIVLWRLSGNIELSFYIIDLTVPGYLVWSALLYSVLGTWITMKIGHPLMSQNNVQQSNEADFRYSLVRLKEYADCIALCKGDVWEKHSILKRFSCILVTYLAIIKTTRNITWISSAYSQLSTVFAFLIASPRYFNDELQLGQLFEISGAYWYVHSALSYIIESYGKIAQWQAVTDRLQLFYKLLAKPLPLKASGITFVTPNMLLTKDLSIYSPAGHILLDKLTLEIASGECLLITGPSGCGKTTLLQALAGIWPYYNGTISCPPTAITIFLPQKPYLPIGSLRDAILYSHRPHNITDNQLREALRLCKLSALESHINIEADWSKLLSLGELQRLSIARVIVHRPQWVFLDETTACIDEATEAAIYQMLKEQLPSTSLITIGHRDTLRTYHNRILKLDSTNTWHSLEPRNSKIHYPFVSCHSG